jgi:hypothetical protein
MREDAAEHRVLENVGEAAGMKGVTVIQGEEANSEWRIASR